MKKILLLAGFILYTTVIFSQHRDYKKIKALKVGYLTEQLELQANEAEAFWPIYNAYEAKRLELRSEERSLMMDSQAEISNLSEKEAIVLLDKLNSFEKKEEKVQEEYINNLQKVLSAKKIIMLFRAEKDFRRRLLHKLRDKSRGQKRPR